MSVFFMQDVICPSCRTPVTEQSIAQVKRNDMFTVSHALCTECKHHCMIVDNGSTESPTIAVLATELTLPELGKALQGGAISAEDVLELYSAIEAKHSTRHLSSHSH